MDAELSRCLQELKLDKYKTVLSGWTLRDLANCTEATLCAKGFPLGPRRKIQAWQRELDRVHGALQPFARKNDQPPCEPSSSGSKNAGCHCMPPEGCRTTGPEAVPVLHDPSLVAPTAHAQRKVPLHSLASNHQADAPASTPATIPVSHLRQTELLLLETLYSHQGLQPKSPIWKLHQHQCGMLDESGSTGRPESALGTQCHGKRASTGCSRVKAKRLLGSSHECTIWFASSGGSALQLDFLTCCRDLAALSTQQQQQHYPCSMSLAKARLLALELAQHADGQQQAGFGGSAAVAAQGCCANVTSSPADSLRNPLVNTAQIDNGTNVSAAAPSSVAPENSRQQLHSRVKALKQELRAAEDLVQALKGMIADAEAEMRQQDEQQQQRQQRQQQQQQEEHLGRDVHVAELIEILDDEDDEELLTSSQPQ